MIPAHSSGATFVKSSSAGTRRTKSSSAFRSEAGRGGDVRAVVLMKLDTGPYAIVRANGASAKQLQRSLQSGDTPRMLDPRIEAIAAGSNRVMTSLDLTSGARYTT